MIFSKKKSQNKEEMKNWYQDRYSSILIQRNFLILFSTLISLSTFVALMVIKNFQENKSLEPFLIEYDKNTGMLAIVDATTKKNYTAQEAIKESYITQYVKNREGFKLSNIEDSANYIRVTSAPNVYEEYLSQVSQDVSVLKNSGKMAEFKIEITSMMYLSSSRLDIKFNKILIADENQVSSKPFRLILNFGFVDLDTSVEDLRLNPLGFQISYYKATEEKNLVNNNSSNNNSNNVNATN